MVNIFRPRSIARVPRVYRDDLTYLTEMEDLATIVKNTEKVVADLIERLPEMVQTEVRSQLEPINTRIGQLEIDMAEYQVVVNDKVEELTAYVNESVQSIINSSIDVSDPVILGVISGDDTQSHAYLMGLIG